MFGVICFVSVLAEAADHSHTFWGLFGAVSKQTSSMDNCYWTHALPGQNSACHGWKFLPQREFTDLLLICQTTAQRRVLHIHIVY